MDPTWTDIRLAGVDVRMMGDDPRDVPTSVVAYVSGPGRGEMPRALLETTEQRLLGQPGTGVVTYGVRPIAGSVTNVNQQVAGVVRDIVRANTYTGITLACLDDPSHAAELADLLRPELERAGSGVNAVWDPRTHPTFGDLQLAAVIDRQRQREVQAGRSLRADLDAWRPHGSLEEGLRDWHDGLIGEPEGDRTNDLYLVGLHGADGHSRPAVSNCHPGRLRGDGVTFLLDPVSEKDVAGALAAEEPTVCWPVSTGRSHTRHAAETIARTARGPGEHTLVVDGAEGMTLLQHVDVALERSTRGLPPQLLPRPLHVRLGPDVNRRRAASIGPYFDVPGLEVTPTPRPRRALTAGVTRPTTVAR